MATPEQVREVLLGQHGLATGASPDRPPIVAVMSTVSAQALQAMALESHASSARVIDASVSGGVLGAEQETFTIITGGDAQDVKAVRPVFAHLAKQQLHCGALGDAQSVKVVNNTLAIAVAVIGAAAYRLAPEQGLDVKRVAHVIDACSRRNRMSGDLAGPRAVFASMTRDPSAFASLLAIVRKDVGLAADLSGHVDGPTRRSRR